MLARLFLRVQVSRVCPTSFCAVNWRQSSSQSAKENETEEPNKSHVEDGRSESKPTFRRPGESELLRHLRTRIMMGGGPLSVAEFMKEALTHPQHGYYMTRDVFGTAGDFVTAPEISQMFGELVGIWTVCTWQQMNCPEELSLIELGPGRGTLMADLLRGTSGFAPFVSSLKNVHFVEVSHPLRKIQWKALKCTAEDGSEEPPEEIEDGTVATSKFNGCKVQWHRGICHVPKTSREIILGHEYLDALPVHQFVKTEQGWCERLVDVTSYDDPSPLRFVLSPQATAPVAVLATRRMYWMDNDERSNTTKLEVGGQMLASVVEITRRVSEQNGAALLMDYGKDGYYESSVQAIKNHEFVDLLETPGEADLSAHVDFRAVRHAVGESRVECDAHGPVEQGVFLKALGIDARLQSLCEVAGEKEADGLKEGYRRLVAGSEDDRLNGMGKIYKAFAIVPKGGQTPVGFEHLATNEPEK